MLQLRKFRLSALRSVLLMFMASAGVFLTGAPASAATIGVQVTIQDHIALPGQDKPDAVSVYSVYSGGPPYTYEYPYPVVLRGDKVIADGSKTNHPYWWYYYYDQYLPLADLQTGDVISIRDGYRSGQPEIARYTYAKTLRLDAPVCAGKTSFTGVRYGQGTTSMSGSVVRWASAKPGNYPGYPGYPSYGDYYPGSNYPGSYPGYSAEDGQLATVKPVGDAGFSFTLARPAVAGSHAYVEESFRPSPSLFLQVDSDQIVVTCPGVTPPPADPVNGGDTGGTSGGGTPSPTPGTTVPLRDVTGPVGQISGLSAQTLRKLGRKRLLAKGPPGGITVNEEGRLKGTIDLVDRGTVKQFKVDVPIKVGSTPLSTLWSKPLKKAVAKASRKAKLRVALIAVDAAGNAKALPVLVVRLPR